MEQRHDFSVLIGPIILTYMTMIVVIALRNHLSRLLSISLLAFLFVLPLGYCALNIREPILYTSIWYWFRCMEILHDEKHFKDKSLLFCLTHCTAFQGLRGAEWKGRCLDVAVLIQFMIEISLLSATLHLESNFFENLADCSIEGRISWFWIFRFLNIILMLYALLLTLCDGTRVLVRLIGGYDIISFMRSPFISSSLSEFWGKRWNLAVQDGLKRVIYKPTIVLYGKNIAISATYACSTALHIVPAALSGASYNKLTWILLYFAVQTLFLLYESMMKVWFERLPVRMRRLWTLGVLLGWGLFCYMGSQCDRDLKGHFYFR